VFEQLAKNKENFKTYEYGNGEARYLYGFKISDIEKALLSSNNVFIIIRNTTIISEIAERFEKKYRVTRLFIYSDKEALIKHYTKSASYSENDKAERMKKTEDLKTELKEHYKTTYNEPVIYFSERDKFYAHLKLILDELNHQYDDYIDISPQEIYLLPRSLKEYKDAIINRMTYKERGFNKNIFLMMDFHDNANSEYEEIKKLLEGSGYNCVCLKKGDNDRRHWNIRGGSTENFIAVMFCCKYGIALFDKPSDENKNYFNPNVMYELGIMHQQRKRCLILVHNCLHDIIKEKKGVPYDFAKDNYETYDKETEILNIIRTFLNEIQEDSPNDKYLPLFIR
jgi:hypothetical protein